MSIKTQLQERFPESTISIYKADEKYNILQFDINFNHKKYTIICTDGLSEYTMPVSHKYEGSEHIELCFCLDADWDLTDANYNWAFEKIEWLGDFLLERQTWFGVGHTIPNGKPPVALSKVFTQDHFIFDEASVMTEQFQPLLVEEKQVHFLFIIPISKSELQYKMKKTIHGFKKKMKKKGLSEILEDFRIDIADKDWLRFIRK